MRIKGIITNLAVACLAFSMPALAQEASVNTDAIADQDMQSPEISSEDWLTDTLLAYAPHGGGGGGGEHMGNMIKDLSITDAQLEKLSALKDQYEDQTGTKRAQLHSIDRHMHELMSQATVDRSAVTALHNKAQAIKDDLSNMHLSYMLDRSEVFTADQRTQMHHMMLVHQFGHGLGHQGRHGHEHDGHGGCEHHGGK